MDLFKFQNTNLKQLELSISSTQEKLSTYLLIIFIIFFICLMYLFNFSNFSSVMFFIYDFFIFKQNLEVLCLNHIEIIKHLKNLTEKKYLVCNSCK